MKLTIGALILLVCTVGIALLGHAIWRGKERARADALVAVIRARGEPTVVEDLLDAPVPDDQNIVVLLKQAHGALVEVPATAQARADIERDDDYAFNLPLNDAEVSLLRGQSTDNAVALAVLAGVSERDAVAWDNPPKTPAIAWLMPELNHERELANLLGDQAKLATHEGRWLDALESLRDIPPIAKAVSYRPSLVGYLVAVGIEALAAERYIELAPGLAASDPAVRAATERAITMLLDDARIVDFTRRGLAGERVIVHDTFRAMAAGTLSPNQIAGPGTGGPGVGRVMSPLAYRADAVALEYFTIVLGDVNAPSMTDFAPTSASLAAIHSSVRSNNLEILASILLPSLDRALLTRYRVLTDRHLAATMLAIRLYQQEHNGARPEKLDDLVPRYLPTVTIDGISGKPLGYDAKRAILWGVGEDEIDGNGDTTPIRPTQPIERYNMKDTVVFLDRQPRPAMPATAPSAE